MSYLEKESYLEALVYIRALVIQGYTYEQAFKKACEGYDEDIIEELAKHLANKI